MYKLFLLIFTVAGFTFAGSLENTVRLHDGTNDNQYAMAEDTSSDDKLEAGRRRGKGNRGRRRGGGGLR